MYKTNFSSIIQFNVLKNDDSLKSVKRKITLFIIPLHLEILLLLSLQNKHKNTLQCFLSDSFLFS